jgi:sigma-E factor negative regulatory protein RseB
MPARNDVVKWLGAALLVVAGQATAQEDARQWLEQMSAALETLTYDGTFVYLHGDRLEAMRIVHRQDDSGERERLFSLTGSAREVLRDDKVVTCIMPDNKSVMVGQSRPRKPFPVVPRDLDNLSRYYHLVDAGEDRMAGYMARLITVMPKDDLRYGYRFWIEAHTRMLLKFDLTDVDGSAIEQVMFTRMGIGEEIPEAAFKPSLTGEGYTWHRQEDGKRNPQRDTGKPGWEVGRLPAGFRLTGFQQQRLRKDSGHAEHLVFSDGLATVSVYVEKPASPDAVFRGPASMGAMNAYGELVDGFQVTVVGEVPATTVKMIAGSVGRQSQGMP